MGGREYPEMVGKVESDCETKGGNDVRSVTEKNESEEVQFPTKTRADFSSDDVIFE